MIHSTVEYCVAQWKALLHVTDYKSLFFLNGIHSYTILDSIQLARQRYDHVTATSLKKKMFPKVLALQKCKFIRYSFASFSQCTQCCYIVLRHCLSVLRILKSVRKSHLFLCRQEQQKQLQNSNNRGEEKKKNSWPNDCKSKDSMFMLLLWAGLA